jgi:AraC-like DNA-binding protein
MKHSKIKAQFRYYEVPPDSNVLALLGAGWIREYGNDTDILHFHNFLEIGYCVEGGGTMNYVGKKHPYTKGSITVVPPNYIHHTNSYPGEKCHWEYLFVDVESVLEKQFPGRLPLRTWFIQSIYRNALVMHQETSSKIADLILAVMDEHRSKGKYYKESVKGLLQSLIVCLARLSDDDMEEVSTGMSVSAIAPAIDYVAKHYREKITILSLAETCHLSETHFRRLFSQSMNISPQAYINLIRIEEVCKLLQTTEESISEIAVKCGFMTPSTLNRNFKEIVGMSPMQFRKDEQYYTSKSDDEKILSYEGWR